MLSEGFILKPSTHHNIGWNIILMQIVLFDQIKMYGLDLQPYEPVAVV